MEIKNIAQKTKNFLNTPKRHEFMVFLVFLGISAVLWIVMQMNKEVQRDMRCRIEITNIPDSVTMLSTLPEAINVNVSAHNSQFLRYDWGSSPVIKFDYKYFIHGNTMTLGDAELRTAMRNLFGSGAQILAVNPDSLTLLFTSLPPRRVAVTVDSHVTTAPNAVLTSAPTALTDSVLIYSAEPLPVSVRTISTAPVALEGVAKSQKVKVKLEAPKGCRTIPDSVYVAIDVEKLINTSRKLAITPINVPKGSRLLLFPNQVDVNYMIPISELERNIMPVQLVVDYRWLDANPSATKLPVLRNHVHGTVRGLSLNLDSVSFMVEQ